MPLAQVIFFCLNGQKSIGLIDIINLLHKIDSTWVIEKRCGMKMRLWKVRNEWANMQMQNFTKSHVTQEGLSKKCFVAPRPCAVLFFSRSASLLWLGMVIFAQELKIDLTTESTWKEQVGIVRGNPGVQNLNPHPTLHKPLPLVKGKGFEGSGSGFWRVEGYKGFVKGFLS